MNNKTLKISKKKIFFISILILIIIGIFSIINIKPIVITGNTENFIGHWTSTGKTLDIYKNGSIRYTKEINFRYFYFNYSINSAIIKITEKNIITQNLFFIKYKFIINKKPYKDGKYWKMIINGNEFKRKNYDLSIPEKKELEKLIIDTLINFNIGLKEKSFNKLYKNISEIWKKQSNITDFNKAFKKFLEINLNLDNELKNKPIFTKQPYINKNNLLILEGNIYSKSRIIGFSTKYIYEYPEWKLIGIHIIY